MTTINETRIAYTLKEKYYSESNGESGSKFAPVRKVIYEIPSIDECLKHLPKDVGNHILSYTTAWLQFYLENLRKKYDYKFFRILLCEWLFKKTHIWCMNTKRYETEDIVREVINFYPRMSAKVKSKIPTQLAGAIAWRQTQIALKAENLLQRKQKSDALKQYVRNLAIGSIVDYRPSGGYYLNLNQCDNGVVVNKKTTSYTIIRPEMCFLGEIGCDMEFDLDSEKNFNKGITVKEILPVLGRRHIAVAGVEIDIPNTTKGGNKIEEDIKQQIRMAYFIE
jgi:hypothetical protein